MYKMYSSDSDLSLSLSLSIYIYIHTHTHTHHFFQSLFPYRLLQNTESSSLCYTVGPCWLSILYILGFPSGCDDKVFACNAGDPGSIPGSGTSPGEGNGNPLQYPCQEDSSNSGAWRTTVHDVAKSWTRRSN